MLAWTAFDAAALPQALQRCAAILDVLGDREPSRALVDCLSMQSRILANLGQVPEAAASSHRALALARELDYRPARPRPRRAWSSAPCVTAT